MLGVRPRSTGTEAVIGRKITMEVTTVITEVTVNDSTSVKLVPLWIRAVMPIALGSAALARGSSSIPIDGNPFSLQHTHTDNTQGVSRL